LFITQNYEKISALNTIENKNIILINGTPNYDEDWDLSIASGHEKS